MSIALQFANLNLAIVNNDLETTKLVVEELNNLTNGEGEITINSVDMQTLSEQADNESFKYFLLNFKGNQAMNRELWYFLSNYIPQKHSHNLLSDEEIHNFVQSQMDLNYYDDNKEFKYYTLIRLSMLIRDYDTIAEIKNRLSKGV